MTKNALLPPSPQARTPGDCTARRQPGLQAHRSRGSPAVTVLGRMTTGIQVSQESLLDLLFAAYQQK